MKPEMTRREMIRALAGAATLLGTAPTLLSAEPSSRTRLGICAYSYAIHWKAAHDGHPKARFKDTLEFIDYCHEMGAGGVQIAVGLQELAYAAKVRQKIESFDMYFEAQTSLPKDESDLARFETD